MTTRSTTVLTWLISLVNPPPFESMSRRQKAARILLFTVTLVMVSILSSMLAAVGIFAVQHMRHMMSGLPQLAEDIGIIFVCMLINSLCVLGLLKVKNADQKLIPPTEHTAPTDPDPK